MDTQCLWMGRRKVEEGVNGWGGGGVGGAPKTPFCLDYHS